MVAPTVDGDICPATKSIDHLVLRCRTTNAIWNELLLTPLACISIDIMYFMEHAVHRHAFAACAITLWQWG